MGFINAGRFFEMKTMKIKKNYNLAKKVADFFISIDPLNQSYAEHTTQNLDFIKSFKNTYSSNSKLEKMILASFMFPLVAITPLKKHNSLEDYSINEFAEHRSVIKKYNGLIGNYLDDKLTEKELFTAIEQLDQKRIEINTTH